MNFPSVTQSPYNMVVNIVTTWSDNTRTQGSGVLVGRNDVLTAAARNLEDAPTFREHAPQHIDDRVFVSIRCGTEKSFALHGLV